MKAINSLEGTLSGVAASGLVFTLSYGYREVAAGCAAMFVWCVLSFLKPEQKRGD